MTKQDAHHHRPGAFKQVNKSHKTGRHRSKGGINGEVKGKVNVKTLSKRIKSQLGKEARRHQAQQIRQNKRDEVLQKKRHFGSSAAPPILIALIPLQKDLNIQGVLTVLKNADETASIAFSACGAVHLSIPRFKQRFSIIIPPVGDMLSTLDAAKVADTVLFLISAKSNIEGEATEEIIDSWGENIILTARSQGLPTTIVALIDLDNLPQKKRQKYKQLVENKVSKWLPEDKISVLDKSVDALNILRRAGSQKQRNVFYRSKRPYLIAEKLKYSQQGLETFGTLEVTGYLRGMPLSVNGLVHLPGFGDFQMTRIDAPEDPYSFEKGKRKTQSIDENEPMEGEVETKILQEADPIKQESLQAENIPDPMDAEQTWPTEEELRQAAAPQKRKLVKVVPKGTSQYQAAWIPDEDAEGVDDLSESEDEMSVDEGKSESKSEQEDEDKEDYETMTMSETAQDEQRYDEELDLIEERQELEKIKKAKLDAEFPDEVDTPQDMLAKFRFQKYRGLESFRTTPWDSKENLPIDYARIFQFQNFDRTRKRILRDSEDRGGVLPGWYITIHIKKVSQDLFKAHCCAPDRPLLVFGLLPHEHKMSVLNVILKRTGDNLKPIKSKERLVFQCGFRRFVTCPIFSQHTNGNKHKYERFFQPESTVVASMFAPITYSPCPVLCFVEKAGEEPELVATGSILSANPDRLVIKRVVLSGHPFKVHKNSAVIRFMFFNREDINWFKPIQLTTKYGRRGYIKEPLGTHGHMKCQFDNHLKSQDTVLMKLYKRVFPKWTYETFLLTGSLLYKAIVDEEME